MQERAPKDNASRGIPMGAIPVHYYFILGGQDNGVYKRSMET